ncbi:MAG: CbiX/SirB N-terminal domain-containing protein [Betaproteobacteria bacterium]
MSTAIVLFAHGSRDPLWHRPIQAVAEAVARREPAMAVRCAYLELSTPSLPDAVADLLATGVRHIRVFPVFLGVGKHAREDLPALMQALRTEHPTVQFELLPSAGEAPALTELLAELALGQR